VDFENYGRQIIVRRVLFIRHVAIPTTSGTLVRKNVIIILLSATKIFLATKSFDEIMNQS